MSAALSGPSHLNSSVAGPSHPPPDCNVISSSEIAARFSSMEGQLGKVLAELEDIKKSLAKKNFLQKGSPKEVTAEYIITLNYVYTDACIAGIEKCSIKPFLQNCFQVSG